MRNVVVVVLCVLLHVSAYAGIRINEVMQSNVNGIMDDNNEYPDSWVEVYNDDTISFDFTGYSISRSSDFTESYPLMDSTVIAPKGFLLIYCDKDEELGGRHANFRLDVELDTLYIFDPVGHIVDSLIVPEMLSPDISYGRVTDGSDTLSHFKKATPNAPNEGLCTSRLLKKPEFSVKGGIYQHPVVLRLSLQGQCPTDAVVRYTTNGSEPTEDSPIAPDSILIEKTTVIRAKTFSDSALSKISKTETYILPEREYTLPIISIVTDSANFYDDEIGIMVEGTYGVTHPDKQSDIPLFGNMNYLFSWKRPINVEYFDLKSGSSAVINQLCETEIGGNSSAVNAIKSLNLRANKRFGDNKFSYPFFADKPNNKKFKSLYLRNSGQDFVCIHFRDALNQMSFGQNVDVDWQAAQPVVVLINGKYYGLLNLREKINADYVWSNYDKLENIDMIEENAIKVKCGDLNEFLEYRTSIEDSLTSYDKLDSLIDLNEMMNYFLLSVFYCNKDFPGNNQILWKERVPSARWRYIIKDTDVTADLMFNSNYDYPYFNYVLRKEPFVSELFNTERGCKVFMKAMSFPEIYNQVIDRLSVYMGTFVSVENCTARFDSIASLITPEIPYFYNEIGRSTSQWDYWKKHYMDFIVNRVPFLYNHTHDFFGLGDTTSLKIKSTKKELYFNGVPVKKGTFDGTFYYGRPIYLSASDTAFRYVGDSIAIVKEDSMSRKEDGCWYVSYVLNDSNVVERYYGKSLFYTIPIGAKNVLISNEYQLKVVDCDSLIEISAPVQISDCGLPVSGVLLEGSKGIDNFGNSFAAEMRVEADSFFVGHNIVEWVLLDAFGDTSICRQTLNFADLSAPVLPNCDDMEPLVVELREDQGGVLSGDILRFTPVAEDNCQSRIAGQLVEIADTFFVGTSEVHWRFTDLYGNTSECRQTIEVVDRIAPVFDGCEDLPEIQVGLHTESCGIARSEIQLEPLRAIDGLEYVEGTYLTSDTLFIGKNDGTWLFADASGNALYCNQTIVVVDSFAPFVPDCESLPVINYKLKDERCSISADELTLEVPSAFDNCGGVLKGELLSVDSLYIGETEVVWVFTDNAGNSTQCQQTVVVEDAFAPVYLECDSMPTLKFEVGEYAIGLQRSELRMDKYYAEDNCSTMVLGSLVAPNFIPLGESVVSWYFVDDYGNQSVCLQKIQVIDRVAPVYRNCNSMPDLVFNVTDNSVGYPTGEFNMPVPVAIDNGTIPIKGKCDVPDFMAFGEHTLQWQFVDASGNTLVCEQRAIVKDRFEPEYEECESMPMVEYAITSSYCAVPFEQLDVQIPIAIDNGGVLIPGELENAPSSYPVGETEVTWVFVDVAGNKTRCQQTIVVKDQYAPYIDCSTLDTIVVDLPLNATEVDANLVEVPLLYAVDNCNVRVAGQMESEPYFQIGTNEVEWTFTDAFGNSSICKQNVKGVEHYEIHLFPNPVEDYLCIRGTREGDEIVVMGSNGQFEMQQKATENITYVPFSGYASGLYFVFVKGIMHKVVKK